MMLHVFKYTYEKIPRSRISGSLLIWKDFDKLLTIGVVLIYTPANNFWRLLLQYIMVIKRFDLCSSGRFKKFNSSLNLVFLFGFSYLERCWTSLPIFKRPETASFQEKIWAKAKVLWRLCHVFGGMNRYTEDWTFILTFQEKLDRIMCSVLFFVDNRNLRKLDISSMTQKEDAKISSGKLQETEEDLRKHACLNHKWRQCQFVSSTSMVLSILN